MASATAHRPPSMDPVAAGRWAARPRNAPAWLHEEVARRMAERLDVIRLPVRAWADWEPVQGGTNGHGLLALRYPDADCFRVLALEQQAQAATKNRANEWWRRWAPKPRQRVIEASRPPDASVQLVWANMLAHTSADPAALLADWHRALAVDGFVMFSCFGPDTLRELRGLYARVGWPPPAHDFTDLHDWGDLLLASGFTDPVMDMEHITLTFESPERLLQELRELGRNLHLQRFGALRGRAWRARLQTALAEQLAVPARGSALALTFEVIYGHAVKAPPRHALASETAITLDDMRVSLRRLNHNSPKG
ncbi:methyltransferase domain-containing protein [Ottowia testudinis]|uniref:Methyltransferase domain-containing protein n=1 Tax=Ottowia testudinis TaxID=2816950 RepID=A0A975CDX7_9BURK|nr:methyltransferase domain-containing protein [Ottowia testudinis]QTD44630.1 methyltransferase domain-containing protein [Ottowia testudinis]